MMPRDRFTFIKPIYTEKLVSYPFPLRFTWNLHVNQKTDDTYSFANVTFKAATILFIQKLTLKFKFCLCWGRLHPVCLSENSYKIMMYHLVNLPSLKWPKINPENLFIWLFSQTLCFKFAIVKNNWKEELFILIN